MKVLEVIASVDPASGGPIEGLLRLDEASQPLCVTREVVSCDAPDAGFVKDFPIPVHAMGPARAEDRRVGPLAHYGYTPRLVPWLKAHAGEYDAVVVNGLWNYAAFGASRALPKGETPYFVFTHGMMDPWFARTYPLKHLAKQAFWAVGEGRLLAHARSVLFTTDEEQRLAAGQFLGWNYKGTVVGYGTAEPPAETPAQAQAFRAAVPALGTRPYLLFLSRIHRKKGCDLLVEAFARLAGEWPDVDLVIAGPDQEGLTPQLQAEAERLGVYSRIHWPGPLYGDAKWGAMRGAEAFVLPSHQENFGVVVAEALACGAPVLLTDKVNIWREVQAGGAGVVGSDDLGGVETMLRRFAGMSRAEREAMGAAARATFQAHFDVRTAAGRLTEVIRG